MSKDKLSITLDSSLVLSLDKLVKNKGSTRSEIINSLLNDKLFKEVSYVVLAGKYNCLSKIIRLINNLPSDNVFVAAGKNNKVLMKKTKKNIKFIEEKKLLGTAGLLKKIYPFLSSVVIVVYGDVEYSFSLENMLSFFFSNPCPALMAVTYDEKHSTDNILLEGNKIISFEYQARKKTTLTSAGIFIFSKSVISCFPKKGMLEYKILPKLAKKELLESYFFNKRWKHYG